MKDITDADYKYSHRVCQDFKKQLGEYHDFYVKVIHYWYLMYLRTFRIYVLKYMSLILIIFCLVPGLAWP